VPDVDLKWRDVVTAANPIVLDPDRIVHPATVLLVLDSDIDHSVDHMDSPATLAVGSASLPLHHFPSVHLPILAEGFASHHFLVHIPKTGLVPEIVLDPDSSPFIGSGIPIPMPIFIFIFIAAIICICCICICIAICACA
jgi:hypothetical protein